MTKPKPKPKAKSPRIRALFVKHERVAALRRRHHLLVDAGTLLPSTLAVLSTPAPVSRVVDDDDAPVYDPDEA